MPARQRREQRVVEQVDARERGVLDRVGRRLERERDVGLPRAKHLQRVEGLGGGDGQLDARMALAESGDHGRQERAAGARERDDAQVAAAEAGDRLEVALGGLEAGEDGIGVTDERGAGVGEPHAPRTAHDEQGPGLALQGRDLLRDRRLRVRQGLGRAGEGPLHRDLAQHPEALDVEH